MMGGDVQALVTACGLGVGGHEVYEQWMPMGGTKGRTEES